MQLVYSYAVWPKEKPIGNGFLGLREYRILNPFFMGKEQFGTKTIYPSKYKKVAHIL